MSGENSDPTEDHRRALVELINSRPRERKWLEMFYGQVWDTQELQQDFEVAGFLAPFVLVWRKSDGMQGSLIFQHLPRFYWSFTATPEEPAETPPPTDKED
jgi:hypothetical protein